MNKASCLHSNSGALRGRSLASTPEVGTRFISSYRSKTVFIIFNRYASRFISSYRSYSRNTTVVCSVVVIEPAPRYPVTMAMDQTPLVTLQLLKVVQEVIRQCYCRHVPGTHCFPHAKFCILPRVACDRHLFASGGKAMMQVGPIAALLNI